VRNYAVSSHAWHVVSQVPESCVLCHATCCNAPAQCRREEVEEIYSAPLLDLVFRAATMHRKHHDPNLVQKCTLLSIKTGGCPEDCNYCSQSSKHSETTGTKATKLMDLDEVYEAAKRAKDSGSTRFCMGAAWRGPSQVRPVPPLRRNYHVPSLAEPATSLDRATVQ
jgi:biotin synthase-like enzyme